MLYRRKFFNIKTRLEIARTEFEALEWAALYLIPPDNLAYALKCGITEREQLAKWFNVTEAMLDFRLKLPEDEN